MSISEVTTKAGTEAATLKKSRPLKADGAGIFPPGCHSRENRSCHIQRKGRYLRKELLGDLRSITFLGDTLINPVVTASPSQVTKNNGPYSNTNCRNLKMVANMSAIYQPQLNLTNRIYRHFTVGKVWTIT
jgi:hypothetical protein